MTTFPGITDEAGDLAPAGGFRGPSRLTPVTLAKWLMAQGVTTRGGDNDLESILQELVSDLAGADVPALRRGTINILTATDLTTAAGFLGRTVILDPGSLTTLTLTLPQTTNAFLGAMVRLILDIDEGKSVVLQTVPAGHIVERDGAESRSVTFTHEQTGDVVDLQVVAANEWRIVNRYSLDTRLLPLRDLQALPADLAHYQTGRVVSVEGETYKKVVTHATLADLFEGASSAGRYHNGAVWKGAGSRYAPDGLTGLGEFTSNFDNIVAMIAASSDGEMVLVVRKSAYESKKGANIQAGDSLGISLTYPGTNGSDTATAIYRDSYTARDGNEYLTFWVASGSRYTLFNVATGQAFHLKILDPSDGSAFFEHGNNVEHWLVWEFAAEIANQQKISDEIEQIETNIDNLDARIQGVVNSAIYGSGAVVTEWPDASADGAAERIWLKETTASTSTVPSAKSHRSADYEMRISHEPGEYVLTDGGEADVVRFVVAKQGGYNYGFVNRGKSIHQISSAFPFNFGTVLHSPLGSAIPAAIFARTQGTGDGTDAYFVMVEEALYEAWTTDSNTTLWAHFKWTDKSGVAQTHAAVLGRAPRGNVVVNGVTYHTLYHTAVGVSSFMQDIFDAAPTESAEDIAARTVTMFINGASSDTATKFFIGGSRKGYTFDATVTSPDNPVLSPSIRHLSALTATEYADLAVKDAETLYAVDGVGLYHGEDLLTRPGHSELLWTHTTTASNWHATGGGQILGTSVAQQIWDGLGGDNAWAAIEAEISWTQTIDSVDYLHVGLIIFPGWRAAAIGSNLPTRLHGIARFGGNAQTSSLNAILNLVARGDASSQNSHMWIENFNPDGQTGIVAATNITVRLYGVR